MDHTELLKLRQRATGINRYLGIRVLEISDGGAVCELDVTPETLNPLGMAHGGTIFTLCDIAAGSAAASRGNVAVTLTGSINYLKPGVEGERLRAVAAEIKAGKSTAVYTVDVVDGKGARIANSTFTMFYTGRKAEEVWAEE